MNNNIIKKMFIRRFMELIIACIVLSAIVTFCCVSGIIGHNQLTLLKGISFGALVYLIINILLSRDCYFFLANPRAYYICTYSAYAAFALINLAFFALTPSVVYTWLFSITNFAHFFSEKIPNLHSVMIFHAVMLIMLALAPSGIKNTVEFKTKSKTVAKQSISIENLDSITDK